MEEKKWHDLEELMNERGFQNLVKGIQAQNIAKISLFDVIERRWKMFIARLSENEREHISTFVQCLKDKNIRRIYMCSKDKQIGCGHADCQNLLSTLMNDGEEGKKHRKTEHTTSHSDKNVSYSDNCFYNYWELAKLFLGVSIDDDIALRGGLDLESSIKLMKNCWLFKFHNCDYIYSQILEDIELLVYAPSLTITEEKLNGVFQNLIMLLKKWKDSHVSCLDATTDINQLEHSVVDCKQIENKLLVKNVLEIIDSVLNLDKKEMDFNKNQTKLPKWSVAKSNISSLLVQVNEILSAPEPDEVSEMKEENEKLKKEIQTLKDQLDNNREDAFQENWRLKQIVKQCDKDICLARLQHIAFSDMRYSGDEFLNEYLSAGELQVACFGSLQDVFIQLNGISILFDPLEDGLLEADYIHDPYWYDSWPRRRMRSELVRSKIGAVVLSTCMNSFTETTVKEIIEMSPGVKWLIPSERKDCLIHIGVDESSITAFEIWDEKSVKFSNTEITFACTPTSINSTSSHRKMCNDCGWIIKGSERTFYSSGITNYNATNFKEIGRRYGPIHLALLPIIEGPRNMSCLPKFTVSTKEILDMHVDLQAKQSLGIDIDYRHNWWYTVRYDKETELKKLMSDMKMEPSEFHFLEPGKIYTRK